MKKLTIAIPTYNRLESLKKTLSTVIRQVEHFSSEVSVFVSNNCSSDGTGDYLVSLKEKYNFLDIDNLPENRGPDGNFLNILRKVKSEYVHILSDDDLLMDGTISKLLSIISKKSYGLIFLNSCVFYHSFSLENLDEYRPTYVIDNDIDTQSKELFIDTVKLEFTFLSSLVFNKECFDKIEKPEQYLNTNWFQSYIALLCTDLNKNIYLTKSVCIAQRQLTTSPSFNPFKVFGPNLKQLVDFAISLDYPKKKLEKLYYKRCHTMYRSIGKYKIDKKPLFKDFKPMFNVTKSKISFWLTLYPWLLIPRFVYAVAGKRYFGGKK